VATPKGKAKAPHNHRRPESPGVRKALERMDMDALYMAFTPQQRRFCDEYTVDRNGTAAAIRAGYSTKYPERQAHLLLKNRGIATYIDFLTASKAAKIMSVDPDWVMQGVVKVINDSNRSGDKLRGYELVAKILGMLKDKTEISGPDGGPIEMQRVEEDAAAFVASLKQLKKRTPQDGTT
jgi:phage terminase small subunit